MKYVKTGRKVYGKRRIHGNKYRTEYGEEYTHPTRGGSYVMAVVNKENWRRGNVQPVYLEPDTVKEANDDSVWSRLAQQQA